MRRLVFLVIICCLSEISYAQTTLDLRLANPMSVSSRQIEGDYSRIQFPMVMPQDDSPVLNLKTYTKELEKTAKGGDAAAMVEVGKCYLFGNGIDANNKKAQKWFEEAIESNNADALFWMGYMYETGKAKKIKLASAFAKLRMEMNNSLERYSLPREEAEAYRKASGEYYQRAAAMDQPDALYKMYCLNKDLTILTMAAEKGNMKAQYDLGANYLNQFKSLHTNISNLTVAKQWFAKAAEQGHPDAAKVVAGIEDAERQIEIAKREAQERARQEALEAARRDSIQRAQAEQQRKQDSIDYATGVRLRPYSWLVSDCDRATDGWRKRLFGLTRNNMFLYKGKSDPDGLDLAIYNKSEEAQEDKRFLSEHKKDKFAFRLPMYYMEFAADGFSFQASSTAPFDDKAMKDYLKLDVYSTILFPIKPICVKKEDKYNWKYTFKCNDINKLQKIKSAKGDIILLLIFNAGLYHPKNKRYEYVGDDVYITKPVGMYVVNEKTDEVLLDLSNNIRIPTTAEFQKFDNSARLEYTAKKNKKDDSPSMPMVRRTCTACGGTGIHVWPSGNRDRCMGCDGKGYTLSYF